MTRKGFVYANLYITWFAYCWLGGFYTACLVGFHTVKKSVLYKVQDPARYVLLAT